MTWKSFLVLIFIISVLLLGENWADAAKHQNFSRKTNFVYLKIWIAFIQDKANLAAISIPGTHASGAVNYEPFYGTAICQDLNIKDQLNIGVRYLDIRCKHYLNKFHIHHGSACQAKDEDDRLKEPLIIFWLIALISCAITPVKLLLCS